MNILVGWEHQQGVQLGEGRADRQGQLRDQLPCRDPCCTQSSDPSRGRPHRLHLLRGLDQPHLQDIHRLQCP